MINLFTSTLFSDLLEQALNSPRLRVNFDLRNSSEDTSQRMLNALQSGTKVPVHRHKETSETVILLKGKMKEIFYDENGKITDEFLLNQDCIGINIPKNQWHTIEVLEPSIIIEMKDGSYKPLDNNDIMTF